MIGISRKELSLLAFGLAAVVALAFLPIVTQGFWLTLSVNMMLYAAMCTAWVLFSGPTHLVSLASAAFFGIGTYAVAIWVDVLPFPLLLVIGAFGAALMAALVGMATLRLSGVYFVIFTLGLAELIRQTVPWIQTRFSGVMGLYVFTDITEEQIYWMLLALTVVIFLTGWLIERSRLGFAMRIIGDDEVVARHVGIDVARSKVILFMISGAFIGVAGAIMAPRYAYVEPQSAFNPMTSFLIVIMALLGGTRRMWGPLVGVVPFTFLMAYVSGRFPNHMPVIVGGAFLLIVFLLPRGVTGLLEDVVARMRRKPETEGKAGAGAVGEERL